MFLSIYVDDCTSHKVYRLVIVSLCSGMIRSEVEVFKELTDIMFQNPISSARYVSSFCAEDRLGPAL